MTSRRLYAGKQAILPNITTADVGSIAARRTSLRLSEGQRLKLGTVLVALTLAFSVAVLGFCDRQDKVLAANHINIKQLAGEVR